MKSIIIENISEEKKHPADDSSNIMNHLKEHFRSYKKLKRFWNDEEYPIEDSFINLVILKKEEVNKKENTLRNIKKAEDVGKEEKVIESRDRLLENYEAIHNAKNPIKINELFKDEKQRKIILYGRAGIGKTTLCQYIATEWAANKLWNNKFDGIIWLRLREISNYLKDKNYTSSIADIIRDKSIIGMDDLKPTHDEINLFLRGKKLLFILDGYDEITQEISNNKLAEFLQQILTDKSFNILVTSRPTAKLEEINGTPINFDAKLENVGFISQNIKGYIEKFSKNNPEKLWNFLQKNKNIFGIAHIPINLELILGIWDKQGEVIENINTITGLYREITAELIKRYETKYPDKRGDIQNQAIKYLENIAFEAIIKNQIIISPNITKKVITSKPIISDEEDEEKYNDKINWIEEIGHLGFVNITGDRKQIEDRDMYFLHLTIQEYFAASYIAKAINNIGSTEYEKVREIFKQHKYTGYYELIWRFVAGILYINGKEENDYMNLMRFWDLICDHPRELIGGRHTALLIRCLDECEADQQIEIHKQLFDEIMNFIEKMTADYQYQYPCVYMRVFVEVCQDMITSRK